MWSNFLNDVKSSPTSNNKQVEDTTNSKIKNDTQLKPKTSPATLSKPSLVKGGGLTSILSKINKQPKISTLVRYLNFLKFFILMIYLGLIRKNLA